MKTASMILTELILDLTTHELHLRPLLALWARIGGTMPGARLTMVWARIKLLRAALDQVEQDLSSVRSIAEAAMDQRDALQRELSALRALAFVNRPTVNGIEVTQ